jgi:hypothetical protein
MCLQFKAFLYLFSQAPGWKASEHAAALGAKLSGALHESGFEIDEASVENLGSGFAAAVVARAAY